MERIKLAFHIFVVFFVASLFKSHYADVHDGWSFHPPI